MDTIAGFIRKDMTERGMSLREYADFLGSTHPTVSKYLNDPEHHVQWDFLVRLSRATHTDIGTLSRIAAPDVAVEIVPDVMNTAERLNQLPAHMRQDIFALVDAYLTQNERAKNRK